MQSMPAYLLCSAAAVSTSILTISIYLLYCDILYYTILTLYITILYYTTNIIPYYTILHYRCLYFYDASDSNSTYKSFATTM